MDIANPIYEFVLSLVCVRVRCYLDKIPSCMLLNSHTCMRVQR